MAIWQFVLRAAPRPPAANPEPMRLSDDELERAWEAGSTSSLQTVASRLAQLLPEAKAWSPNMRAWGDDASDDVQIWLEEGRICSARFRLDVRQLSVALVNAFGELAREFDWLLVDHAGFVVRPSTRSIMRAIMRSPARSFVADPEGFLSKLAPDAGDDE